MSVRTLAQLRAEVRERADMEDDDQFVTDAEVARFINQSIRELYDLLIENSDQEFFATSTTIPLTGAPTYALPSNFYRLLGVDIAQGGKWLPLQSFRFQERNDLDDLVSRGGYPVGRYRLRGSSIAVIPASLTGMLRVWYIPRAVELAADADTFDGYNGWEEYVVLDAAAKCRDKEQTDAAELYGRKAQIRQRIESLAAKRDAGGVETVTDVTESGWWVDV